jgi:hypothetical protein
MTITSAPLQSKTVEITDSNIPLNAALINTQREAKNASVTVGVSKVAPQNLFSYEGLVVQATEPKSELGKWAVNQLGGQINEVAANQIVEFDRNKSKESSVAAIPAGDVVVNETSNPDIKAAVEKLNLTWVEKVGGMKDISVARNSGGFGLGA